MKDTKQAKYASFVDDNTLNEKEFNKFVLKALSYKKLQHLKLQITYR